MAEQQHAPQDEKGVEQTRRELPQRQVETDDDFQMPELRELYDEAPVAQELEREELEEVYANASDLDFSDPLKLMKYGLDDEQKASAVTRRFINDVRSSDLEHLSDIARGQNEKMEELNIGELEPGFVQSVIRRVFPKAQASAVAKYLDKHRDLSTLIDDGEQALGEEWVKLETLQAQMKEKVGENQETYDGLTRKIGAAELAYAADKKRVAEYKKKLDDEQEAGRKVAAAKLREVSLMDQGLAMQSRRINSLKASRQETLNSLSVMDLQVNRIHSQMQMINEQRAFNRLVWDNTVMMAATDKQMKSAVESVQYNRESIEKMMKDRTGSIAETLNAILQEEKAGVVNAAVLEYAAKEILKMNHAIIHGNNEIRESMKDADAVIERLDADIKEVLSQAAAMSEDDLHGLDEFLKSVPLTDEEKEVAKEEQDS